jgi:hypothetical protein
MADDESYDLMPHKQISELKRQMQELKSKIDKASPKELINSMNTLTKSIDAMLKLFTQAADELKFEEKEESLAGGGSVNEKLDKIMDQNKVLADGMVAISDMVKELTEKQKNTLPRQTVPRPSFQPPPGPPPNFQQPPNLEPQLDQPPAPQQQGPVAMPSMPFSDIDEPKKSKKKGLFGRLKI